MTGPNGNGVPTTPLASASAAQSRSGSARQASAGTGRGRFGIDFVIADRVGRAAAARIHERQPNAPLYRPLRIFTLDPTASKRDGATSTVNVPYEPLEPGPRSEMFEIRDEGTDGGDPPAPLDLEQREILMQQGLTPSATEPRFRAQMAYAVCHTTYAAFRQALGRELGWGFQRRHGRDPSAHLRIRCCVDQLRNAFYDPQRGELCFGAYRANAVVDGRNAPGQLVYTVLLHDVVVHEMAHALLDGLRARLMIPTNPDVLAFHEAFADMVAIFQRFTYRDVVRSALRRSRGNLSEANPLTELGRQFGDTTGMHSALRNAVIGTERKYGDSVDPHERGEVLVAAVFKAFSRVYWDKASRFVRLASDGTGVLRDGELPPLLVEFLTDLACKVAAQFLSICIRAIDYCPPVDVTFGEYLRAVITADADLVPDDPWAYREAWIDAFRAYDIYPPDVPSLSEDALVWRGPERPLPRASKLGFDQLQFAGDPARPASARELERQARALGELVGDPEYLEIFGLARAGDPDLAGDRVDLPMVESIRTARRVGPNGQVVFDLVAEVTQRRHVAPTPTVPGFHFYGGSTVILDPTGVVRYVVRKSVLHAERLEAMRNMIASRDKFWEVGPEGVVLPHPQPFRLVHQTTSAR